MNFCEWNRCITVVQKVMFDGHVVCICEKDDQIKEEDPLELNNFTFACNPIKTEQVLSLESVKSKEKVDIAARDEKKCNKCGKIFRYLCSLSAHIKCIHDKVIVKSHKCDFCDHTYTSKANLTKHHLRIHEDNGEKPKCTLCGKTFKSQPNLKIHISDVNIDTSG